MPNTSFPEVLWFLSDFIPYTLLGFHRRKTLLGFHSDLDWNTTATTLLWVNCMQCLLRLSDVLMIQPQHWRWRVTSHTFITTSVVLQETLETRSVLRGLNNVLNVCAHVQTCIFSKQERFSEHTQIHTFLDLKLSPCSACKISSFWAIHRRPFTSLYQGFKTHIGSLF